MWSFEEREVKRCLKLFKKRLVSKCLGVKGWEFVDGDDTVEQMFKALIFINSNRHPEVVEATNGMFGAFLAGRDNAININIQEPVFAITLKHGGVKEVQYHVHLSNNLC